MRNSLCLLWLAVLPLAAQAAPPSDDTLRTLFEATKAESLMDSIYGSLESSLRQAMQQASAGRTLTPEQQKVLDLAPQRLSAVMRSELSWARLLPMQMAIYRETFTQEEVDGLIAFYRSPVGRSFVDKMPVATQRAMAATQTHVQQVMPRIKAAMDEVLSEARLAPPR